MIDSSGVAALSDFMRRCRARGVAVIVSGIRPQPKEVLTRMGFGMGVGGRHDTLRLAENFAAAREMAAELLAARPAESAPRERKSVVSGKSVSARVDLGGRRLIKKKN